MDVLRRLEAAILTVDQLVFTASLKGEKSRDGTPTIRSDGSVEFWSTKLPSQDDDEAYHQECRRVLQFLHVKSEGQGQGHRHRRYTVSPTAAAMLGRLAEGLRPGWRKGLQDAMAELDETADSRA